MRLPEEFKERMKHMLGAEYPAFLASYEMQRNYGLRVNTLKILPEEFKKISPFSLRRIPWTENGFFYEESDMPSRHPFYFAGLYYLQEPSAMAPAARLPVRPGDRVLDLCAAPGGKATELAFRLRGKGILTANEISASRGKALLKNMELMGAANVLITNEKPGALSRVFGEYFDKILVDAPCSGEGMFRKEPEVIKSWDPNRPAYFAKLQENIVDEAVKMLKPGGLMMYSTCTFSKEENEGTVSGLLLRHPEMELCPIQPWEGFSSGVPDWGDGNPQLERCVRIWPHRMEGEGHFMALLRKEGEVPDRSEENTADPRSCRREELERFLDSIANRRFREHLEVRGEKVYQVPDFGREIRGVKFLRNGLLMGEMKKIRFEPSQALAMALKAEEFDSVLKLNASDERVERYLRGETIVVLPGETSRSSGWQLVCVEGFPLGWGKLVNGVLKNKYLNAWRKN